MVQPNGKVLGLLAPNGKLSWKPQNKSLWGLSFNQYNFNSNLDPNLLFAGQYYDEESGLAYNRFRYYDPETACYLNSDPIGLEGGSTPYFYVQNPLDWVDLFGLAGCNQNSIRTRVERNIATSQKARTASNINSPKVTKRTF
ncbi:RHS repeat-associated core domain-containing protein [Pelistega ratti]|uniref:RHS repeat-associated core domain-containing protein n=1 Tax=Pelistega ratti TaxID=2652177 RepID=UPI002E2C0EFC|nr:RHS repeat-associated core domain-containing protein [Pelistega ratti]